jgi:asparagine synthase (glutamine-hydrolysing)
MIQQVDIHFQYPFLYNWSCQGAVSIITNGMETYFHERFSRINSVESARNILQNTIGNFAVVSDTDGYFFASTDLILSFPVFYKMEGTRLVITGQIQSVEKHFQYNKAAVSQFKKMFFTGGAETLLENWKQLQAGEFLFIDKKNGHISLERYADFRSRKPAHSLDNASLRQIYLQVHQEIIDQAAGRPLIVPLSGGYDSRCILAALKELNAKNVFVYTYGSRDSYEKIIAEKVARQLGFAWQYVEYDECLLDAFLQKHWQQYAEKAHFFTSLPNEQDFFALLYLSKNKLLPENGIALPGYLGDYFSGNKFHFEGVSNKADEQQDFLFANRGSKYIVNSVRLFEFFNIEWKMPFSDKRIIDYLLHVPLKERQNKNTYNDFLSKAFFQPLQIDFKKPGHFYKRNRLKTAIKNLLPGKMLHFLQDQQSEANISDPNNSAYLKKLLLKQPYNGKSDVNKSFNEVYAEYFIQALEKSFSPAKPQ